MDALSLANHGPVEHRYSQGLINNGGAQNIPILTGMGLRNMGPLILTTSPLISTGK